MKICLCIPKLTCNFLMQLPTGKLIPRQPLGPDQAGADAAG